MTSPARRDWLLQQLGYTQWSLRRPAVLQGEIAVILPLDTRLVIVSAQALTLSDPLIQDILRTLGLTDQQVLVLTPKQAEMLPVNRACNSWCLGMDKTLVLPGVKLISPDRDTLSQDAAAKRALWRQICENEHDFFPETQ